MQYCLCKGVVHESLSTLITWSKHVTSHLQSNINGIIARLGPIGGEKPADRRRMGMRSVPTLCPDTVLGRDIKPRRCAEEVAGPRWHGEVESSRIKCSNSKECQKQIKRANAEPKPWTRDTKGADPHS